MKIIIILAATALCSVISFTVFAERGGFNGNYGDSSYHDENQNDQSNNQNWNHNNNQNWNQNNQNWNHDTGTYVVYGSYGNSFFYRGLYFSADTPDGFVECTQTNPLAACEEQYSYYPYSSAPPPLAQ